MLTNMQVEVFKYYQIDQISVFPSQTSGTDSNDDLMDGVTGYIMKMNTRKANLDIIDKTSLFRPLYSINYNNFTLPTSSPVDVETKSYTPASDFIYSETSYEINSLSYIYKNVSIPTLEVATDMMIYFSNTTDSVTVPNNSEFTLNQAHTKDNLMDDYISITFQLYKTTDLNTPLGSDSYDLIKSGNTYKVKLKSITSGTFYAKATASQGGFYTYYDFTLVVRCTNNCDLCSNINTCDTCSAGYSLTYQGQCESNNSALIDSNVVRGLVASAMLSILAIGALQMQISSNLWVFINTLQILRTILLLKINLPISVREMINSSTVLTTFDFGIANRIVPDPPNSIQIDQIMNGDSVLSEYFNDYGIQTYRFMEFVETFFFDTLCTFIAVTLITTLLSFIYLKIRKRSLKVIKDKILYIFIFNGLIRMYFENLLDGITFALINLRSLKFIDYVDAFSYLLMSIFIVFCIFFTIFFVIYTKFTSVEKWNNKIKELLSETNERNRGIIFYHLIFTLRRLILIVNAILLGVFPPNVHISIHAVSQLIVFLMFCFVPMYENRFQKVSNLVMESCNTFVFFSAYYFQNSSDKSIFGIEANMGLEVGVRASGKSEITDVNILVVEVVNSAVFGSVFINLLEFAYNIC